MTVIVILQYMLITTRVRGIHEMQSKSYAIISQRKKIPPTEYTARGILFVADINHLLYRITFLRPLPIPFSYNH